MSSGTVRYSEVYGRTAQASRPLPPAVNLASGPPDGDAKPTVMFLGMGVLLIVLRFLWERGSSSSS